ncbi:hypothetical protein PR048_029627 [Dryococelus australis]|uniref:Uncharacterized protein n=1 Tax=Dryococelus australis TaxID=614101 RepID=A0ABQ9GDW7_9NEOP|nr:hypothetical protein PR048_029627 [Dryococelus australis]
MNHYQEQLLLDNNQRLQAHQYLQALQQHQTQDCPTIHQGTRKMMKKASHYSSTSKKETDLGEKVSVIGVLVKKSTSGNTNFFTISFTFLHFSDDNTVERSDCLFKLRPNLNHFRIVFKHHLYPFENICIKKKQYIPAKQSHFGFKKFLVCNVQTNYILDLCRLLRKCHRFYETQSWHLWRCHDNSSRTLFAERAHIIFLAFNACHTVRHNRKVMPKMAEKLQKGQLTFKSVSGLMLAMKWCDRRDVYMLSTFHSADKQDTSKKDYKAYETFGCDRLQQINGKSGRKHVERKLMKTDIAVGQGFVVLVSDMSLLHCDEDFTYWLLYRLWRVAWRHGTKSGLGLAVLRTAGLSTHTHLPAGTVAQGSSWLKLRPSPWTVVVVRRLVELVGIGGGLLALAVLKHVLAVPKVLEVPQRSGVAGPAVLWGDWEVRRLQSSDGLNSFLEG